MTMFLSASERVSTSPGCECCSADVTELGLLLKTSDVEECVCRASLQSCPSKPGFSFQHREISAQFATSSSIPLTVAAEAGASAWPWWGARAKEAMKLRWLFSFSRLSHKLKASRPGEFQPRHQHFHSKVESLTLLGFTGAQEREILQRNANSTKKTEHN